MKNQIDCRIKENKRKFQCIKRRFCNKRESPIVSIGKGVLSLTHPTVGIVISSYEAGRSLVKFAICE